MANFLDSIRTLFKLSGSQALPSGSVVSIGVPTNDVYFEYTAPSDGYIVARIISATNCRAVQIETNTVPGVWVCNDQISSAYWGAYIPVRKGQVTRTLVRYDAPGMSQILFVPTVGAT